MKAAPVYSLLPPQKNIKFPNHCDISFDLRKGKTGTLCYYIIALPSFFFIKLLNTRERKVPIYLYYGPWMMGK